MKILITGSSGTIGTRLFERLNKDHEVTGIDIRPNHWHRWIDEKTIRADLRHSMELAGLPQGFDLVVHLAANARVYELLKEPRMALDNMVMTFNVLEYIRKNGIGQVVFASSRETYGNIMQDRPISEAEMRVEYCEGVYAASKITGEALLHAYQRSYGLDFVIIRFSNVYGMYDDSDRVIPLWFRQCLKSETLSVFNQDKMLDFTYIDDAIDGVIKIINKFGEVKGETFNLSTGDGVKLLDVAQSLRQLLKSGSEMKLFPNRRGEVIRYTGNITKAKKLLGYQPKIGINEGLEKTVAWYRAHYA